MGVEAEDNDEDESSRYKLEDAREQEAGGQGTVATTETKAAYAKGNGVDGEGDEPESGPEPAYTSLYGEGKVGQGMYKNHVRDNGDGKVPEMLGEDGADEDVAEEGARGIFADEVDLADEAGGRDDDGDGGDEIAGGEAED